MDHVVIELMLHSATAVVLVIVAGLALLLVSMVRPIKSEVAIGIAAVAAFAGYLIDANQSF